MKKNSIIASLFLLGSSALFAQMSTDTDFLRTQSASGGDDGPSAAIFNPAATAFLNDGVYIRLGNQFSMTEHIVSKSTMYGRDPLSEAKRVVSFMGLNGVGLFAWGPAAFYVTASSPDQQGETKYFGADVQAGGFDPINVGPILRNFSYKDNRWELGLGGSYAFTNWLAVSTGLRLIIDGSEYATEGSHLADIYSDKSVGAGFGAQAGVVLSPISWFALSVNARTPSIIMHDHKVKGTHPESDISAGVNMGIGMTMPTSDYKIREIGSASIGASLKFKILDMVSVYGDGSYAFGGSTTFTKNGIQPGGAGVRPVLSQTRAEPQSWSAGGGVDWDIKKAANNAWGVKVGGSVKYIEYGKVPYDYQAYLMMSGFHHLGRRVQAGFGAVYSPSAFFDIALSAAHTTFLDKVNDARNTTPNPGYSPDGQNYWDADNWYASLSVTFKPGAGKSSASF